MKKGEFLSAAAVNLGEELDRQIIEELMKTHKEIPARYSNKSPKNIYYFTI
ncbi:MAG: hypothetical protein LBH96_01120 [Candidatus Peribacteria bacterium]|jgi:hypothetical protein|nr:hypothetical protein [Candidatus Peribacteria bacterium]